MAKSPEERITALEVRFDDFQQQVLKNLEILLKRTDNIQVANGTQNIDITYLKTKLETTEGHIKQIWRSINNLQDDIKNLTNETHALSKRTIRITAIAYGAFVTLQLFLSFVLPHILK